MLYICDWHVFLERKLLFSFIQLIIQLFNVRMIILERASPTPFPRGIPGLYFNPETIIISTPKSRFEFPRTQLIEQCPNN